MVIFGPADQKLLKSNTVLTLYLQWTEEVINHSHEAPEIHPTSLQMQNYLLNVSALLHY